MTAVKNNRGVALVMAILIVAMVTIISVHLITQRQLQFYRTSNQFFRDQAYQYSLAVEGWGMSVLSQDFNQNKAQPTDSHHDLWNTGLFDIKVDQVTLDGSIFDLQGRFNLNNLVSAGKVQNKWLDSYKRLLQALDLPVELAEPLVDWLDSDEDPTGSYGAEDIYYMSLKQPYRTANQPLAHLTELLLIKGYDKTVYDALKPHVYVVPNSTTVNINTTTNKVLTAMVPGLSESDADTLLTQVEKAAFASTQDFMNDPLVTNKAVASGQIGVTSEYFALNSYIEIDKTKIRMQSIIKRDAKGLMGVLSRQETLLYGKHVVAKQ